MRQPFYCAHMRKKRRVLRKRRSRRLGFSKAVYGTIIERNRGKGDVKYEKFF